MKAQGDFKMKHFVKCAFCLLILVLISLPAWASGPRNSAIADLTTFHFRAADAVGPLPIAALCEQFLLAKGGNGGGNGAGAGGGNGGGNGGSSGNDDGSGAGGTSSGSQAQNQQQHQQQHQYSNQVQQDEQHLQYQNHQQHHYRHGQTPK